MITGRLNASASKFVKRLGIEPNNGRLKVYCLNRSACVSCCQNVTGSYHNAPSYSRFKLRRPQPCCLCPLLAMFSIDISLLSDEDRSHLRTLYRRVYGRAIDY